MKFMKCKAALPSKEIDFGKATLSQLRSYLNDLNYMKRGDASMIVTEILKRIVDIHLANTTLYVDRQ